MDEPASSGWSDVKEKDEKPPRSRSRSLSRSLSRKRTRDTEHGGRPGTHRTRTSEIADAVSPPREDTAIEDAESLASISAPPSSAQVAEGSAETAGPPAPVYAPFAPQVVASLMAASVFGVLTRLGLLAITTYDGRAIFPLAWVQAAGCLAMGFALGTKDQIGAL